MIQPVKNTPLVGRSAELAELRLELDGVGRGRGATWLVSGEAGVGKTRLGGAVAEEALKRGWYVASGRAFPVESGVPYALFSDALMTVTRHMDADALTVLTRGVGELASIFPWLPQSGTRIDDTETADFRSRLHWHFTQVLRGLVAKLPLVVVLEDLQWADTSSLDLLHFVARQMTDAPLFLFCTFNPDHPDSNVSLQRLRQSLGSVSAVHQRPLEPLDADSVAELLQRLFGTERTITRDFTTLLYRWTKGNPFFVEETLKALVASGDLRQEEGRWIGWQLNTLRLPPSVSDAVLTRLEVLDPAAREAADTAAVLGARFRFETLAAAVSTPPDPLLTALDELVRARVLEEVAVEDDVVYDFVHPLIRETLYGSLGRVRVRLLHARVADSMERRYAAAALEHADELAYHFARAHAADAEEKAVLYLRTAGERALTKHANREAADYLAAALNRMQTAGADPESIIDVAEALARAQQRLGEYRDATALWQRVQDWALGHGEPQRAAAVARRMALACYWTGRLGEALSHLEAGLSWATQANDAALRARLFTAKAACLQELGRYTEALQAATSAMEAAGPDAEPALLVRVHRTFLQLHLWTGEAALAREHGARALELADRAGDGTLAFMAHWAMGVLEAFAGNSHAVDLHVREANRLADELRSPVLRAWVAELALEHASARGDWETGLTLGEDAIQLARALHQWNLLPRLLVWTGLIYVGRSEIERGEAYIEEAWQLSGAGQQAPAGVKVHVVIPAYIGRASVSLAKGQYEEAIRIGEQALAVADQTGYPMWGVHRVLPLIAESYLWLRQLDGARRTGARLRRDAERLGHGLGLAWADACDALVAWLGAADSELGAVLLRQAAERLEAVPFMPDATRLRRQLAGRLAEIGDREAAVRELRLVHDRLLYLGAEQELRKARLQFREMGLRPPPRGNTRTQGVLTEREQAVAALVAERESTKAIAQKLGIARRTVDAHLTNIYRKLNINKRVELGDLVRSGAIADDE
jgi:DNA-binding CsgD family transcriptional regulator